MKREEGSAGGTARQQRQAEPDDQTQRTPAVLNMVAEDIEGVSGA